MWVCVLTDTLSLQVDANVNKENSGCDAKDYDKAFSKSNYQADFRDRDVSIGILQRKKKGTGCAEWVVDDLNPDLNPAFEALVWLQEHSEEGGYRILAVRTSLRMLDLVASEATTRLYTSKPRIR
ncbi:hypothetical protein CYMTET_33004 [Cymbomonas tetramitiformis]|uniref:Uncharacterized protein n=1 Tax=Cymbomonas tetramitiformis TaxID=36881 RepID=A0AAE0FEA1_9CHLO|nr:hypothetical protein CYMTET_33004 [Cymbomonas tetramitiformis]